MRVLIVEDEPDLLKILAQSMRETGFAVDTCDNGQDGLHKAMTCDYDAIVLDWMLPKMSGIELLKQLRIRKRTPVLLLTARDAIDDRVLGLDGGADDYLVKPFNTSELLARIRALIRRSAHLATNQIIVGDLTIDTAAKTVSQNGAEVTMTGREFAILELLALRQGELVSRTLIYEHIFDENDDSLSNIVDVHVSHLRKKLGHNRIETRRGMGYILHE